MGRNKKFDPTVVLHDIGWLFIKNGYNGTSLDDIVKVTGILRGSLYSTFGSKLGMFIAAFELSLHEEDPQLKWGLLLIAMLEVAPQSTKVAQMIQTWYATNQTPDIEAQIGHALLRHSGIITKGE
ncbi:TetR/AcrR family transcriptional regulator [Periweissella fabalis]|uniref:Helix-turn-helix transcriptional regulator n=1 Tax=Periweissella fabalis TaxID=1070421 RepID=A0A7X6S1U2_9LACO|nr:helix-turn-helix domain-containing protein [Periweissella fabalis]MCM0599079.1 helix-turn-helix transcriptional regulator [Periweissella fabalis]NKZ23359.1 helix-turn-helix transcriptional regulator [Periweissella fabalis]